MKKYTLFLLVFIFVFGLFNINVNFVKAVDTDCIIASTLRIGSTGSDVVCLQTHLGLSADGKFGPKTTAAVMAWQSSHGLVTDGAFGARSIAVLVANGGVSGNFPAGCQSVSGYSTTTGAKCVPLPPVSAPTSTGLPAGCTSTAGYSPTTGMLCNGTGVLPPPTKSTVTVLSPNGGETWLKGTTQTINWTDSNNISTHEINLVPYYPPCTSRICPSYPYHAPYTIANTQGSSYNWYISPNLEKINGLYKIQVCQTGTTNCDSSDAPFTISETTACSSSGIDTTTGFRCGCSSASGFSLTTGIACDGSTSEVPTILSILPDGCNSPATTYNSITGEPCANARIGSTVYINGLNFNSNTKALTFSKANNSQISIPINFISTLSLSFIVPSSDGSGTHGILVKNQNNSSNLVNLNFIDPNPNSSLVITNSTKLPDATVGQYYSTSLNTSGVDSSNGYNWSADNSFPKIGFSFGPSYGNSINITGTPSKVYLNGVEQTVPYSFTFNVTVSSGSQTTTKQFSLTVNPAVSTCSSQGIDTTTGFRCGCSSDQGYSVTTGASCAIPSTVPGCTSTTGYSVMTGQPCDGTVYIYPTYTSSAPIPPSSSTVSGCSSNQGYSVTTGASCNQ